MMDARKAAPSTESLWWTAAAAALLLRVSMMPYGGFPTDISTFKAWAATLAERGPGGFYGTGFADYLPGYLYILWAIGKAHTVLRFNDPAYLFVLKLPAVLADIATAWAIAAVARRLRPQWALPLSVSYLFSPGIIFTSAYWGQVDSVGALFALTGLGLATGTLSGTVATALGTGLLAAGVLIKPQTGPALLIAAAFTIRRALGTGQTGARWDPVLNSGTVVLITLLAFILPFRLAPTAALRLLGTAAGVYPYGSVVAFNLWGAVQGFWHSDQVRVIGIPIQILGIVATAAALAAVLIWLWRRPAPEHALLAAATALVITFMLPTRMHERYLLPALPFLAVAAAVDRRMLWVYAGLSGILALNVLYAFARPYLGTFILPAWLEATALSPVGVRVLSALATLTVPAMFVVLVRKR